MTITVRLLQLKRMKVLRPPDLLKALATKQGFKSWTLQLNPTEWQKVRHAEQNKDEKSITSMLLRPQKGIQAIAQPTEIIGGGAGI